MLSLTYGLVRKRFSEQDEILLMFKPTPKDLWRLRATADYLFGKGAGEVMFPGEIEIRKSRGRIREVRLSDEPICAVRASDGVLILNRGGAKRLNEFLEFPKRRVVVEEGPGEFIAKGRTAFAKHVVEADLEIRPGEEVLVVDVKKRLLASGSALLSGEEMVKFRSGQAVRVRRGFCVEK